jgi:hypothetical protein
MSTRRLLGAVTLALGLAGAASVGAAQVSQPGTQEILQARLAAAKSLKCTFQLIATGTWKDGAPQGDVKPVKLSLQFVGINTDEGTSRMLSPFGTYDMIVQFAGGSLHFIQAMRAGALYTTTVFPKENGPGTFKAVHSRHEYVEISLPGFTSRPEQYYGECEVV